MGIESIANQTRANSFTVDRAAKARWLVLAVNLLLLNPLARADGGALLWAHGLGSTSFDRGYAVAVDSADNLYVAGSFAGTVDFDPGPGVTNLTSNGGADILVAKYDSDGNLLWAHGMGGGSTDIGRAIGVDADGNVYATGYFYSDTVDFDPGPGVSTLFSWDRGVYVLKLSSEGSFVWVRSVADPGFSESVESWSLAVDGSGSVYTVGDFEGSMDFDPGPGTAILNSTTSNVFVSKLNTDGNFVWAKALGGRYAFAVTVDVAENVLTTGEFGGTRDFDPGAGVSTLTSAGDDDAFIAKLDSSGNFVWARAIGGTGTDNGEAISTDSAGNVYSAGHFEGAADFDPGPDTTTLVGLGSQDIYIAKFDPAGNFLWARSYAGTGSEIVRSLRLDSAENVYTTGRFQLTVDFDPGSGVHELTSTGNSDMFVTKLTSDGGFLWARGMGGIARDDAYGIAINSEDDLYVTGEFYETMELEAEDGIPNLVSAGDRDIFLMKLSGIEPPELPLPWPLTSCGILGAAVYILRRQRSPQRGPRSRRTVSRPGGAQDSTNISRTKRLTC